MPLVQVIVIIVAVGVLLWLINSLIPMEATIKQILNAVVIIGLVLWLLSLFGLFDGLRGVRVGR